MARPGNIEAFSTNRNRNDAKNNDTKPDVFRATRARVSLTATHGRVSWACALAIAPSKMLRGNYTVMALGLLPVRWLGPAHGRPKWD